MQSDYARPFVPCDKVQMKKFPNLNTSKCSSCSWVLLRGYPNYSYDCNWLGWLACSTLCISSMSVIVSLKTLANEFATWLRLYSPLNFQRVSISSRLICSSCSIEHPLDPSTSLLSRSSTKKSSTIKSFWDEAWDDAGSTGESFRRLARPAGRDIGAGMRGGALKDGTAGF